MRPCEGRGGGFDSPRTPWFLTLPCLADSSAGPPKAGGPVRLWRGVLGVVSRISSAGSTKPGWQVRLLHDLLLRRVLFPVALCEEAVAKIRGKRGFRFIKELGGAVR